MMKRMIAAVAVLGFVALVVFLVPHAVLAIESSVEAVTPADRVVVMYFHRTQRCPTCLKMGGYSEEAITAGFAQEIKKGTVEFHYIDFQDKKNEALTSGYQVAGPTLIVAHVVDNKVKDRKNLTDIWTKVRDKAAFITYVQSNVKNYLK